MALYVNTNIQSIFGQRALAKNTRALQRDTEKLSTGYRINRSADDAAGLSIVTRMSSQIRGVEQAVKNISDGISMVQTAEGSLSIIQENMQRIRELVVQAANGTNSENELAAMQREANARVQTISDITAETEFNGIYMLDPGAAVPAGVITLQSGANQGDTTTVDFNTKVTRIDQTGAGSIGFGAVAVETIALGSTTVNTHAGGAAGTRTSLDDIDTMVDNVSMMRSELGATQNALETKREFLDVLRNRSMASRSRILDADIAKVSSNFVKNQILQQSAAAVLTQANSAPQIALNLLP